MNHKRNQTLFFGALLIGCVMANLGCEPAASKAPPKEDPPSFTGLATKLVEMRNRIRDGFATGNIDAAHGPLHEVGHELEKLETIAKIEMLPADKLEAVAKAKEELFEAFNQVDLTLHGGEGKTYEEVADTIDAALKVITDIAGIRNDEVPTSDGLQAKNDDLPGRDGTEVVEDTGDDDGGDDDASSNDEEGGSDNSN